MGDNKEIQPNTSKQPIGQDEKTSLNLSIKHIIDSLPIGIIAFDPDLKIIESNPKAAEIIHIDAFIDKSLSDGTDEKIWQNWTTCLKECISAGKTCKFNEVEYTSKDKTKLLQRKWPKEKLMKNLNRKYRVPIHKS